MIKRILDFFKPKREEIIIKCEYRRIKKPKKNEFLIFQLKDDGNNVINQTIMEHFREKISQAIEKDEQYLIVSGNLEVITAKKKQIKSK